MYSQYSSCMKQISKFISITAAAQIWKSAAFSFYFPRLCKSQCIFFRRMSGRLIGNYLLIKLCFLVNVVVSIIGFTLFASLFFIHHLYFMLQRLKFLDPLWPKNTRSATVSTVFPALEIQRGNVVSKGPFPYFEQRLRRHKRSEVGGKEQARNVPSGLHA